VPYHWVPEDPKQSGSFCVFTEDFFIKDKSHSTLEDLPIFQPGNIPLFEIDDDWQTRLSSCMPRSKKRSIPIIFLNMI
jgi:hypothetical protein